MKNIFILIAALSVAGCTTTSGYLGLDPYKQMLHKIIVDEGLPDTEITMHEISNTPHNKLVLSQLLIDHSLIYKKKPDGTVIFINGPENHNWAAERDQLVQNLFEEDDFFEQGDKLVEITFKPVGFSQKSFYGLISKNNDIKGDSFSLTRTTSGNSMPTLAQGSWDYRYAYGLYNRWGTQKGTIGIEAYMETQNCHAPPNLEWVRGIEEGKANSNFDIECIEASIDRGLLAHPGCTHQPEHPGQQSCSKYYVFCKWAMGLGAGNEVSLSGSATASTDREIEGVNVHFDAGITVSELGLYATDSAAFYANLCACDGDRRSDREYDESGGRTQWDRVRMQGPVGSNTNDHYAKTTYQEPRTGYKDYCTGFFGEEPPRVRPPEEESGHSGPSENEWHETTGGDASTEPPAEDGMFDKLGH